MRKTKVMTKLKRNQNGITLIALVITIIVLLILAGVAISMLSGENGILKQAAEAKTEYSEVQEKEEQSIAEMEWEIYKSTNATSLNLKEGIVSVIPGKTIQNIKSQLPEGYNIGNSEGQVLTNDEDAITVGMTIVKDNKIVAKLVVIGDANEDELVNGDDSILIQDFVNGDKEVEKNYIKVAMDVNNDGKINKSDSYLIELLEAFMIEEFPDNGYTGGASSIKIERILEITKLYDETVEGAESQINEGETIGDINGKPIEESAKATTNVKTGMTIIRDNEIVGRVVLIGDVDCDGLPTEEDAKEINLILSGETQVREDYIKVAMDVNNDGKINSIDSKALNDLQVGEIENFERGNYAGGPSLIEIETE